MGIFPAIVHLLKAEHLHRPIEGDLLLIGRQVVHGTTLTDVELFAAICPDARVRALDVSDYEGADIVHDLCMPLPTRLNGIADFIYDGSCLDNIHDAGQAMRSMSAMLKPSGRMFAFEHGTMIQGALCAYSPEWFFDFFAANQYADCQIKLGVFKYPGMPLNWILNDWHPFDELGAPATASPRFDAGIEFVNLVLAEKDTASTNNARPIQAQYRALHGTEGDRYLDAHHRYQRSLRRIQS